MSADGHRPTEPHGRRASVHEAEGTYNSEVTWWHRGDGGAVAGQPLQDLLGGLVKARPTLACSCWPYF